MFTIICVIRSDDHNSFFEFGETAALFLYLAISSNQSHFSLCYQVQYGKSSGLAASKKERPDTVSQPIEKAKGKV